MSVNGVKVIERMFKRDANLKHELSRYILAKLSPGESLGRLFLRKLSQYTFEKYATGLLFDEEPDLVAIHNELNAYRITHVEYEFTSRKVILKMVRPGVFIGVKGSNFEAIHQVWKDYAFELDLPFDGIKIVEDTMSLDDDLHCSVNGHILLRDMNNGYPLAY